MHLVRKLGLKDEQESTGGKENIPGVNTGTGNEATRHVEGLDLVFKNDRE